jgi:hypothetical protein
LLTAKLASQARHKTVSQIHIPRYREPWSRTARNQFAAKERKERKEPGATCGTAGFQTGEVARGMFVKGMNPRQPFLGQLFR